MAGALGRPSATGVFQGGNGKEDGIERKWDKREFKKKKKIKKKNGMKNDFSEKKKKKRQKKDFLWTWFSSFLHQAPLFLLLFSPHRAVSPRLLSGQDRRITDAARKRTLGDYDAASERLESCSFPVGLVTRWRCLATRRQRSRLPALALPALSQCLRYPIWPCRSRRCSRIFWPRARSTGAENRIRETRNPPAARSRRPPCPRP